MGTSVGSLPPLLGVFAPWLFNAEVLVGVECSMFDVRCSMFDVFGRAELALGARWWHPEARFLDFDGTRRFSLRLK